jgi:NADPH-dependent curcumin reductase CurA
MPAVNNLQVLLRRRPQGEPRPEDFEVVERPAPQPGPGEVLVRARFLSLDPYMRGRMSDAKSYAKPVELGEVMEGATVGEVVESNAAGFTPGDIVAGANGWQRFCVADAARLRKIDTTLAPASAYLGVLGMPGLTAWVGLEDIGQPKSGETVVVSAASGAVGQVVGQIAKARGARVVGIAGGRAKCDFVTEEMGFDACLDHRQPLGPQLDAPARMGGRVLGECRRRGAGGGVPAPSRFRPHGDVRHDRPVQRGAGRRRRGRPAGPNLGPVVRKRLRIQGFIVSDTGWGATTPSWPRRAE